MLYLPDDIVYHLCPLLSLSDLGVLRRVGIKIEMKTLVDRWSRRKGNDMVMAVNENLTQVIKTLIDGKVDVNTCTDLAKHKKH